MNFRQLCSAIVRPVTFLRRVPFRFFKSNSIETKKMENVQSLEDFGYAFNSEGNLRKLNENGEPGEDPFQFNISDNHRECQTHYEGVGEAVTQYVYQLLETQEKLSRLPVPKGSTLENGTFIFVSEDYDKKDILLILIHGSGVVRAGQWARSIIINESLDMGTQIPYIRKGMEKGYGIMVLNTNDNFTPNGDGIPESSNPTKHASYVWDNYVSNTAANSILIVAHSYGGVVTVYLANKKADDFKERVKAIAFTDSVHGFSNEVLTEFLKPRTVNWVTSKEPLDTPISSHEKDVPMRSAGHTKHEMTSYSCMESVFKLFDEKLTQ